MARVIETSVISTEETGPLYLITQEFETSGDTSEPGLYEATIVDVRREPIPLVWGGDYG